MTKKLFLKMTEDNNSILFINNVLHIVAISA